jgi:hypothetical protein
LFLDVALSVVACAGFLGLIIFVVLAKRRRFAQRRLASEQEGHRLAMPQLQHALQTAAGAQLAVVQRVVGLGEELEPWWAGTLPGLSKSCGLRGHGRKMGTC